MNFKRFLVFLLSLLTISLVLHYLIYIRGYDQGYDYESISNSLFIIGVVGFFPAFMAQIGSYKLFHGIQFALRGFISTDFRRKFRNFSDYLIEKKMNIKTTIYSELLLSSGIVLVIALALGLLWGRQL